MSEPSFTDEVKKFVNGLQTWARGVVGDSPEAHHHPRSTCDWCPLCQFADVIGSGNPEVRDRIAEAGTAVIVALRAVIDAAAEQVSATKTEAPRPRPRPGPPPPPPPGVQHISLDGDE